MLKHSLKSSLDLHAFINFNGFNGVMVVDIKMAGAGL